MKPENAVTHFHLRAGDRVADLGAGSGFFSFEMAKAVGPNGRIHAVEIQKNLAETLRMEARKKRLNNIDIVWGDLESPHGIRLGDASLDAALLSNTLFQVNHRDIALAEIARIIGKGGSFFLIEWADSFGGLGPRSSAIIPEMKARALIEAHGFELQRSFPAGAHHYGLAFRRV